MKLCGLVFSALIGVAFCDHKDGGKAPRLALNDGNSIPAMGLGTFLGFDENGQKEVLEKEVEYPVTWALDAGYRLIDTAALYFNERQIGEAIRKSSVPREDIFIVTKLGINEQRDVEGSLRKSLERLNMTHVDLYLIHFPVAFTLVAACSCQKDEILRDDFESPAPDGSYKWAIQTEGGIFHEQRGSLRSDARSDQPSLVVEGQYQYTAPDGQIINVVYRADETGFHAEGAHLPTPPPVPAAIQRALDYLATLPSTPSPYDY